MTAPITTLRRRHNTEPHRYPLDDALEYILSPRGRENIALVALTIGCLAGIAVTARYG